MRTTVELRDDLRAALLAMAARRGEKGYSRVLEEAVEVGIRAIEAAEDDERLRRGLAALGSITGEEGEEMARRVRWARDHWRHVD